MRKSVIAALLAATVATPALAQEYAPFTGPRAEAIVGYDVLKGGSDNSDGKDGLLYGVALGYDVQAGGAIVGIEGEVTDSSTKLAESNVLATGDRYSLNAGRDLYVGARAGVAISPMAMAYVKGGYTNARITDRYTTATGTIKDGENLDGFRVGAGLEYKVGTNAYLKGEYRYSHYSEVADYDIDLDRHQVLAGVGIRF